jgi:hypothetical protein
MERREVTKMLIEASRELGGIAYTTVTYPDHPEVGMDSGERDRVRHVRNTLTGLLEDTTPKGDTDGQ